MKRTRLSRKDILSLGDVFAHDGEGDTGGAGGSEGDEGKTGGAGGAEQDGKKDSQGDPDDPFAGLSEDELRKKARALAEEKDRHFNSKREVEKERDELRKAQDEARRKDQDEVTNLKEDVTKLSKALESKDEVIRRLSVENAFIALKDVEWHNPERALRLVDLSDVEFDAETGKVKDMSKVVKAAKDLAKSDPYLVKSATEPPEGTPKGRSSGKPPAGNGKPKDVSDDELMRKYTIRR